MQRSGCSTEYRLQEDKPYKAQMTFKFQYLWKVNVENAKSSLCRVTMTAETGRCKCGTFKIQLFENRAEKILPWARFWQHQLQWSLAFQPLVWPADRKPPSLMNACPGLSFHGNLRCRGAEAMCALSNPNTHLHIQKPLRTLSKFQNKFDGGTMVL